MPEHKPKLRVVVVDDSGICRRSLESILSADGDIEVVATASDAFGAASVVEKYAPDLVTMDVQMPGKSGLEGVSEIMARCPTPVLVVTAQRLDDESGLAFEAVRNGALDVMAKPSITDDAAGVQLRALVRALAKVPVFHAAVESRATMVPRAPIRIEIERPRREIVLLVAGASGMPSVLATLTRLPALDCPVVLHQPVPASLVSSYAFYLGRVTKSVVRLAARGDTSVASGEILVVADGGATFPTRGVVSVTTADASLTQFLRSAAQVYGERATAVVLGGQGTDVTGFASLHRAGARVCANDSHRFEGSDLVAAVIAAQVAGYVGDIEDIVTELVRAERREVDTSL